MEDKHLNPDQSLELIQQMIRQTRQKVERNAGTPFILMGYTTVVTTLAVWLGFHYTHDYRCQFIWFIIPLVAIISSVIRHYKGREREVSTYIDRILSYIWYVVGGAGFMLSMLSIFVKLPILFIIILLMGIGTALTGLVIRARIAYAAGFISTFLLAPLALLAPGQSQMLVFAAAFVVMMIIPGHAINYKIKRRV